MGLTSSSTGKELLDDNFEELKNSCHYTIALAGNPNVGKSTIFNSLTGMHQHTGNWPGKTVANCAGTYTYKSKDFLLVDIPGTYSLMSNSQEEEIARDYICFGNPDATVVIVDATCIERNLNLVFQTLEITSNVIVCVNLLDEAKKKGISIDLDKLSTFLGVPVVGTTARKPKTLVKLIDTIFKVCEKKQIPHPNFVKYSPIIENAISIISSKLQNILPYENNYLCRWISLKLIDGDTNIISSIEKHLGISLLKNDMIVSSLEQVYELLDKNDITSENFRDKIISKIIFTAEDICNDICIYLRQNYICRDRKIDQILTSKKFGIPIMIIFLGFIFWLTITGANYPSAILSSWFAYIQTKLVYLFQLLNAPEWLSGLLIDGMYQTLSWIVAVMLPPMAIFFPLFTLLEDLGVLPRISFNLDNFFKKACSSGKQALTMCMGFGCNAAGVVGCRIIDSPRERLVSILTNSFVPCNRAFSFFNYYSFLFYWLLFYRCFFFTCFYLRSFSCNNIGYFFNFVSFQNFIKNYFKRFSFFFHFRTTTL